MLTKNQWIKACTKIVRDDPLPELDYARNDPKYISWWYDTYYHIKVTKDKEVDKWFLDLIQRVEHEAHIPNRRPNFLC